MILKLQNSNSKMAFLATIFRKTGAMEPAKVRLITLPLVVRQCRENVHNRLKKIKEKFQLGILSHTVPPVSNVQCISGPAVCQCCNFLELALSKLRFSLLLALHEC